ncbi:MULTISPECIES: sugar transferase [unclassified Rhizobium]|uniref:sugar transferase n=1 Tax=unclassified Rhizobium TaxID=2613769 RepID=UPI001AD9C12F|nr:MULTISPECIES: sugar transferase [unclassified Rhizobium]MBO9127091.1 sugar transferase [Rhizobium sp. 16-488-2b]MBO9177538.1 sugar transferase [Rhizobium sp. 16-488-2a]
MTSKLNQGIKRAFDLCAASGGLVVLSPVLLVLTIMVRRSSPGGAFFRQQRVGRDEVPFTCLKFRTMAAGTPDVGSHDAAEAWITPIGKTLRAYKLDELPQLVNVLKGEMSLVGPRPCLPSQPEVIAARRTKGVFAVRPGITGLAQIAGIDMSTPEKLATADAEYVKTASLWNDIAMILGSVMGKGKGDAALK